MQWDSSVNLGFSTADADSLYLPVDSSEDAPTVEKQEKDPESLLNTVRSVIALRHRESDLQADASLQIICREAGKPLIYRRGSLLCVVNPGGSELEISLPRSIAGRINGEILYMIGDVSIKDGIVSAGAQSFAVVK